MDIVHDIFNGIEPDRAREVISNGVFVSTIEMKADFDAYACVYVRDAESDERNRTIFFHPLLLLACKRHERELTTGSGSSHATNKRKLRESEEMLDEAGKRHAVFFLLSNLSTKCRLSWTSSATLC